MRQATAAAAHIVHCALSLLLSFPRRYVFFFFFLHSFTSLSSRKRFICRLILSERLLIHEKQYWFRCHLDRFGDIARLSAGNNIVSYVDGWFCCWPILSLCAAASESSHDRSFVCMAETFGCGACVRCGVFVCAFGCSPNSNLFFFFFCCMFLSFRNLLVLLPFKIFRCV